MGLFDYSEIWVPEKWADSITRSLNKFLEKHKYSIGLVIQWVEFQTKSTLGICTPQAVDEGSHTQYEVEST